MNKEKLVFLVDTGAEVSLISSSTPGLVVNDSDVSPVSVTCQPIAIRGEAEVALELGGLQCQWKFLVVDDLRESVLGADFIESHHKSSWGIRDGSLWLDDWKVPLADRPKCRNVLVENYSPVVARCTLELPARHQILIPMKTKDGDSRTGLFESTRAPGGVLMSKTVVVGDKEGGFWVKAVNLSDENVMLFKNQKVGILSDIDDCSEPLDIGSKTDCPTVSCISDDLQKVSLEELGIDLSDSDLSDIQKKQSENLLLSYADVFSKGKRDIGKCSAGVQHRIPLKAEATPIKQQLRRVPFAYQEGVKSDLKAMLEDGIIEKSNSEWASPLVIVRKPSGDLRICVDYRKLNEATRVTSYPLPNMTETLDRLADAKYFTTIDMVSGYHQIEVAPEDRHKTAFVSPFGLFQYCRLPFGLAGAPGTFQAVIEDMLQVLDAEDVMAYLDDVICFHSSFEEHLKGVERLLLAIRKSGFKLSGKKCQFAKRSVKFLGHVIDEDGVRPQPEKLDIIRDWKPPQDEADLRRFLGVCTFWRRFVKDFARIAVPLHDLLNKSEFVWTPQCDSAFRHLREILCSSVTLKLPDRHQRFIVSCDASDRAVGFVLEQKDASGGRRPVAFGGRKLNKAECNYSTTEKECLAVIDALKAYRPYLLGREFDLFTDHESLKWLLTRTKEHSGRLWRWVDKFREFQCVVHHIAGSKNTVADALSRVQGVKTDEQEAWSLDFVRRQQDSCPTLSQVKSLLVTKEVCPEDVKDTELRFYIKEMPNLSVGEDGILRHRSTENPGAWQIVIPRNLTSRVLQMMHDDLGHFGTVKTTVRVKEKFFWQTMSLEIEEWCKNCLPCQGRRNPVPTRRAPLQPIATCRPGELVTMDIVEYPLSSQGFRYCLVMVDHFTKWLELYPLRNQKSETIAKKVFDCWIPRHGAPEQIHHDQGKNLTAKMIQEICSFFEIWNTQTTPFHPQSDGASERSIRTVNGMLAKIVQEDQRNWDLYVPSTCLAYNTSVHSSTGFTPCFLEFGREFRLPSDLHEPHTCSTQSGLHSDYAVQLKTRLTQALKTARDTLKVAHSTQKAYYDRWARANTYRVGDRVMWLDKKTRRGRCMKLNRPWTGPWTVVKRLSEVVYRIKYCGTAGRYPGVKRRVVHFNQLKPYHGTNVQDQGNVGREQESSPIRMGDGSGVFVLEDDVFPTVDAGSSSEDPVTVVRPLQVEGQLRRSQRERRPPAWTRDFQMDT